MNFIKPSERKQDNVFKCTGLLSKVSVTKRRIHFTNSWPTQTLSCSIGSSQQHDVWPIILVYKTYNNKHSVIHTAVILYTSAYYIILYYIIIVYYICNL